MKPNPHYLALGFSIVVTVFSHIILKVGAMRFSTNLNPFTTAGLTGIGLVTVLIVYSLQAIDLKTLMAFSSLTYLLMPYAAKCFLNEPVSRRQLTGTALIFVGVIVFSAGI